VWCADDRETAGWKWLVQKRSPIGWIYSFRAVGSVGGGIKDGYGGYLREILK
jgi:hypothetical protein